MDKAKEQKATQDNKNSNQTGTRGPKAHGNDQQRSSSSARSQPTDGRTETGYEEMDIRENDTDQCVEHTKHGARQKRTTHGADQRHTSYEVGQWNTDYGAYQQHSSYDAHQQYNYQEHKLLQLQRSKEASKQMIYGVFGNVISILEEYEKREIAQYQLPQKMPKSKIPIPEQSHKSFNDVKSIVEAQLLLFENHTKVCPPEAISEVLQDLKKRTISWSAVREAMEIKELYGTDFYITKLYEILAAGKTEHKPLQKQEVSEETMRGGFQAILEGDHEREKLDREFKTNKDKKASAPETRGSENLRMGANRISRARGKQDLDTYLEDDLEKLENQDDLK